MRIFWSGAFAILMTAIVSGVWAALLLANRARAPAFPWSSLVMALLLWSFLDGKWGAVKNREARRAAAAACVFLGPGSRTIVAGFSGGLLDCAGATGQCSR